MKILHVANFSEEALGQVYYSTDRKLSNGLIRLGHHVQDFSYRFMARYLGWFNSKKFGISKMNQALLATLQHYQPDFLLFGHSELVTTETLETIRRQHPNLPIAMWYVDAFTEIKARQVSKKLRLIDALYCTTGVSGLDFIEHSRAAVRYMPNVVDRGVDVLKNFERDEFDYALLFCGRDHKDPQRQSELQALVSGLSQAVLLKGCFGNPVALGADYFNAMSQARCGLNYSRYHEVPYYSSDRIAHLTGNGLLTFCKKVPGFEALFRDDEVVYFDTPQEFRDKLDYYLANDDQRKQLATQGHQRAHSAYGCDRIAQYILDGVLQPQQLSKYEWADF